MSFVRGISANLVFAKCLQNCLLLAKIRRGTQYKRFHAVTTHCYRITPKFLTKIGPRTTKIDATSILTTASNSQNSKSPITAVSSKSNEFDKLTEKNTFTLQ